MVTKQSAEDAAIEAAVDQLQLGGVKQALQYTEDVRSVIGDSGLTLDSSAGRVRVYNRETGVASDVLTDQLKMQLKKRFPPGHSMAGRSVFSLQPTVEPFRGEVLCLLHPEHPERPYLNSIGLRGKFCHSSHIASEFDLEGHMQHRHSKEWTIIERARTRAREDEGHELLKQQTELLARMGQGGQHPDIFYCPMGGCSRFFDSAQGLAVHRNRDHKDAG